MKEIYLIGCVQALFFAFLLASKKGKKLNDTVLTFFVLLLGMDLLYNYAIEIKMHEKYPAIILSDFAYWALLGPLLYLYIDTTVKSNKLQLHHLIHLLPLTIVILFFSDYIFNHMLHKTLGAYYRETQYITTEIGVYFWEIISPVYYILAAIKLYKHRSRIKSFYSYQKGVSLHWLNYLTHGFGLFLIVGTTSLLLYQLFGIEIPFSVYKFSGIILTLYIFGIGYFGYKQKAILSATSITAEETKKLTIEKKLNPQRYEKSGLSNEDAEQIYNSLKELMNTGKPYLDCELNIGALAKKLDTTTHKLSQVINERYNKNFYEFINAYRIDEVKKQLLDEKNAQFKIESLAYDCGFNSKSSFYTLFKKYTSLTPSQYRKQYQAQTA